MALRVGPFGLSPYIQDIKADAVDDAILYAVNNGAKVINMSFGIEENISAVNAAINYAFGTKGCILIASNHNGSETSSTAPLPFPAKHNYVLAVGGITKAWLPHSYTNDFPVDICVPSKEIISTKNITSSNIYAVQDYNGCSFAAPQVAGAAALLLSFTPSYIHLDVKNILKSSANKSFNNYNYSNFGAGILNIEYMFDILHDGTLNAVIPQNVNLTTPNGKPRLSWNLVNDIDEYIIYRAGYQVGRYGFVEIGRTQNTYFVDNTIVPKSGVTYYYRITSKFYEGESPTSKEKVYVTGTIINKSNDGLNSENENFGYELKTNYPNPFNPITTIEYSLKEAGIVKLNVFNTLGKEIKTLVNKFQEKGNYSVKFDASKLSSGIYYYRISINDFVSVKKMILTK